MISEIKLRGFDRIRQEIEDKTQEIKFLQNNVSSLENSLRIVKNHTKNCGQNNEVLLKENDKLMIVGGVILLIYYNRKQKGTCIFCIKKFRI
jgi:hypothetical protein